MTPHANPPEHRLRRAPIPILAIAVASWVVPSCKPAADTSISSAPTRSADVSTTDDARGGRIYDKWWAELDREFAPGRSGGPNGDGTLDGSSGEPIVDNGHEYRLKNLFGWDLRGASGIYGPRYQNKPFVTDIDLLNDGRSVDELTDWLARGDATIPAYDTVLGEAELDALVAFVDGVRTKRLPHPAQIFDLSETAPKNYVLRSGADARRGAALYADACARCHGADGRELVVDDDQSMGAFARTQGHETWAKILSGHPGSPMKREIEFASGKNGAAQILDILAALCDRNAFPPIHGVADVGDDDLRCGDYLRPIGAGARP